MTAHVTDLGAPAAPTTQPLPGVTLPSCSTAGGGGTPDRLCIPGDNMGWSPSAQIVHDVIFGDVADVNAGPANAIGPAGWLGQLVAAGASGVDGLGGLGEVNALCTAPPERSGGTFQCDAELWLGVPASAGEGSCTGGLVLTLV